MTKKQEKLIRYLLRKRKKYFTPPKRAISSKEVSFLLGYILRKFFSEDEVRKQISVIEQDENKNAD